MVIGSAGAVTCTIIISLSLFSTTTANFFLSMIFIFLVISKVFTTMQVLQTNSCFVNRIFALLRVRKNIPKITFRLILANKNVFQKNQTFPRLFLTEESDITILKVSRQDQSIFCAPTSIFPVRRPNFVMKAGCIVLTLLPNSIRALMSLSLLSSFFWQNYTGYQMHGTRLKVAFLLISVIRAEVAKTNTSFLRCPGSFEIWNSSLQNGLFYYSCNTQPRLRAFDLSRCMPRKGYQLH